eukprot:g10162.t1
MNRDQFFSLADLLQKRFLEKNAEAFGLDISKNNSDMIEAMQRLTSLSTSILSRLGLLESNVKSLARPCPPEVFLRLRRPCHDANVDIHLLSLPKALVARSKKVHRTWSYYGNIEIETRGGFRDRRHRELGKRVLRFATSMPGVKQKIEELYHEAPEGDEARTAWTRKCSTFTNILERPLRKLDISFSMAVTDQCDDAWNNIINSLLRMFITNSNGSTGA